MSMIELHSWTGSLEELKIIIPTARRQLKNIAHKNHDPARSNNHHLLQYAESQPPHPQVGKQL